MLKWLKSLVGTSPTRPATADISSKPTAGESPRGDDSASQQFASFLAVVGESHYQDALRALRRDLRVAAPESDDLPFTATLRPEPNNPFDGSAIQVLGPDGETLGYLDRRVASEYHCRLAVIGQMECTAELRGGSREKRSIGVVLHWNAARERLMALDPATALITKDHARTKETHAINAPDAHGQPLVRNLNVARRRTRDVSEMLGLAKGMLADGIVTDNEAAYLNAWIGNHPDALVTWPHNVLQARLQQYFADGHISDEERRELTEVLTALVGGTASILLGYEGATTLPLDMPAPFLQWPEQVYVFTGRFAFGTRAQCEREVTRRNGKVDSNVTRRTTFLIVGTFGSEDWANSSYGRKIQRAVELREGGLPIRIVGEDHWASALEARTT